VESKIMKSFIYFVMLPLLAIGALYYFFIRKPAKTSTVATTGTAGTIASIFPGWAGFTQASLASQTQTVNSTLSLFSSLSNAFGSNDGGTNPGVSTGGSGAGGTASTGSGVGLPTTGSYDPFSSGNYFTDLYSGPLWTSYAGVNSDSLGT